ncbi:HD domain-containing protein, partial [Paracoccus sp. APAP_BH8]
MRLDDATIVTALLHDTIEDTRSTWAEVVQIFGREIADLVDGVTKLTKTTAPWSASTCPSSWRSIRSRG